MLRKRTCQLITNPPRISVGEFSAENTGTVTSFRPIPMPSSIRVAASWPQVCERAMPNGARRENMPPMKMTPRRPKSSLRGSEIQPALRGVSNLDLGILRPRSWKEADWRREDLQEPDGDIGHSIHKADDPAVVLTPRLSPVAHVARVGNAERDGERKVGAIGGGLRAVSPNPLAPTPWSSCPHNQVRQKPLSRQGNSPDPNPE